MKKFLAIIPILAVLLFASCDCDCNHSNIINSGGDTVEQQFIDDALVYTDDIFVRSDVDASHDYSNIREIRRFKFDGHDYIQFIGHGANALKPMTVHDPECLKRDLGSLVVETVEY